MATRWRHGGNGGGGGGARARAVAHLRGLGVAVLAVVKRDVGEVEESREQPEEAAHLVGRDRHVPHRRHRRVEGREVVDAARARVARAREQRIRRRVAAQSERREPQRLETLRKRVGRGGAAGGAGGGGRGGGRGGVGAGADDAREHAALGLGVASARRLDGGDGGEQLVEGVEVALLLGEGDHARLLEQVRLHHPAEQLARLRVRAEPHALAEARRVRVARRLRIAERLEQRVGLQDARRQHRHALAALRAPHDVRERELVGLRLACAALARDDQRLRAAAVPSLADGLLGDRVDVRRIVEQPAAAELGHRRLAVHARDPLVRVHRHQQRAHVRVDLVSREAHHRVLHD